MAFGSIGYSEVTGSGSWSLSGVQLGVLPEGFEHRVNVHRNRLIRFGWEKELIGVEQSLSTIGSSPGPLLRVLDLSERMAEDVLKYAHDLEVPEIFARLSSVLGDEADLELRRAIDDTRQTLEGNSVSTAKMRTLLSSSKVASLDVQASVRIIVLSNIRYAAELRFRADKYSESHPSVLGSIAKALGLTIRIIAEEIAKIAAALLGGLSKGLGPWFWVIIGAGVLFYSGPIIRLVNSFKR